MAAYWTAYQRDFHDRLYRGEALVRLSPGAELTGPLAVAVAASGRTDDDGWIHATVPIESVDHAHGEFLRLGTDVEVLEPPELRERIARTAAEPAAKYGNFAVRGDH
ncbi:WYL domain-containing protein [Streptomyces sp. NPDC056464]|uniref:WYL domain-containing protein n=1 Tax=Streptomyces sp. NPDC056464 TaxID=3345828 RepID=UPI0036B05C84